MKLKPALKLWKPFVFFIGMSILLAACSSSTPDEAAPLPWEYLGYVELAIADDDFSVQSLTFLSCASFSFVDPEVDTSAGFSFSAGYAIDSQNCADAPADLGLVPLNLAATIGNSPLFGNVSPEVAASLSYPGSSDISAIAADLNSLLPLTGSVIPAAFVAGDFTIASSASLSGSGIILGIFSLPGVEAPAIEDPEDPEELPTIAGIVAENEALTSLAAALSPAQATTLEDTTASFTLFAPVNSAFEAISATIAELGSETLAEVIAYHLIASELSLSELEALAGSSLPDSDIAVSLSAQGDVLLSGAGNSAAAVVISDAIDAANGLVYLLDTVLLPESLAVSSDVSLDFVVQSYDGALLEGVAVSLNTELGTETVQSEAGGIARFIIPAGDAGDEVVVTASMAGYINQAMVVSSASSSVTPLRLAVSKDSFSIPAIEDARVLSSSLGARITLPANAFVTPNGDTATGEAEVQITPWDITSRELSAMPGNAQAVDASGQRVELISAGMLTVEVYNSNGDYLQLADGVSAEIQMDLPLASINNQALSVGDSIPMWYFDEAQGLWLEDSDTLGSVVASATSPVGLAVQAEVAHFSTWNWDFKFEGGSDIDIICRLQSDNSAVPCAITAEVTLDDGSLFTRSSSISASGATIINMPNSASIAWYASTDDGLLGETSSVLPDDVVIFVDEPTTQNNVSCQLPDGSSVGCTVTVTDGSNSKTQTIPAQGATVVTAWPNVTSLNWSAQTPNAISYNQQSVLAAGTATSDSSQAVVIAMSTTVVEEVAVSCVGVSGTAFPCNVDVTAYIPNASPETSSHSLGTDGSSILVPAAATLLEWSAVSAGTFSQNGQLVALSGEATTGLVPSLTLLLDNETVTGSVAQSVQVRCLAGNTAATSCDLEVFIEGPSAAQGFSAIAELTDVAVGEYQSITFPNGLTADDFIVFTASEDSGGFGQAFSAYPDLDEGEEIDITLQIQVIP